MPQYQHLATFVLRPLPALRIMLAWLIWRIFVRGTGATGCLGGLSHWRNFTITAGIRAKTLARHIERLDNGHAIIEAHKRPTKCKGFSAARRLIAQTHRAVGTTPLADACGLADILHVHWRINVRRLTNVERTGQPDLLAC